MPRTANTDGTVKKAYGDKWIALLPPRLTGGRRTAIEGRFDTKNQARLALNAAIVDIARGQINAPTGRLGGPIRKIHHSVESYIQEKSTDPNGALANKTITGYRSVLNVVINNSRANIGQVDLQRLTTGGVDKWIGDLRKAGVSIHQIKAGRRLLSATLNWELRKNRIRVNPTVGITQSTTKSRRATDNLRDPVLVPTWKELSDLISHPLDKQDRLLISLLAWGGLRWSEAISLSINDVWKDRPALTIQRVWSRSSGEGWKLEPVKQGIAKVITIPKPLWDEIIILCKSRVIEVGPGGDLVFRNANPRAVYSKTSIGPVGIIDNTNWRKSVWKPSVEASGLGPDPTRPKLDPRRQGLKVKDLRAAFASVLVDAGATSYEAAIALRHSDVKTTDKYYARALEEKAFDPARAKLRINTKLNLSERTDALWAAWVKSNPKTAKLLVSKPSKAVKSAASNKKLPKTFKLSEIIVNEKTSKSKSILIKKKPIKRAIGQKIGQKASR